MVNSVITNDKGFIIGSGRIDNGILQTIENSEIIKRKIESNLSGDVFFAGKHNEEMVFPKYISDIESKIIKINKKDFLILKESDVLDYKYKDNDSVIVKVTLNGEIKHFEIIGHYDKNFYQAFIFNENRLQQII